MSEEKQTLIDDFFVAGHGRLLDFVEFSKSFGVWCWSDREHIDCLVKAASLDDRDARDFAISLVAKVEMLHQVGDELRKRIDTIGVAIAKINKSLKEGQQ